MDFDDPELREAFFAVHSGLDREGPGDRACTLRALALAGPLPRRARVADIGCGPGRHTLTLARALPEAQLRAVDLHQPFLDDLQERAHSEGLQQRITTLCADMAALPLEPGRFDLIWSEGAAYSMGFAKALAAWKPLLKPGGVLAVSEATWLRSESPAELRRFWDAEYPQMLDAAGNQTLFEAAGYQLLGSFPLPAAAWQAYLDPIEAKLPALRQRFAGRAKALEVVESHQQECDLYRRYGLYYGYSFFVARVRSDVQAPVRAH